jgi:N4-gp56 family major capsid protein
MALTEVASTNAATVQRWAERTWVEAVREIYWGKFMKEGTIDTVIEVKRDLEGKPGDKLTHTLIRKLEGEGVSGDSTLAGNEELMVHYEDMLTLDQIRNAVRLAGRLSERRTAYDQRMNAKNILKVWLAEFIDDDIFTQFDSSPTDVQFGGNATSIATIDTGSTLTVSRIESLVARAGKASPQIWPVRAEEGDYYILAAHLDVGYDLRQSTQWLDATQEAGPRDYSKNHIFTGRLGVVGGCIVHAHRSVPIATNYGAAGNLTGASMPFLGRQAGVFAWGQRPEWWEKEFDYGNQIGFAIGAIWDFKKAVFNAADNAVIVLRTFRTSN